MGQGYYPGEAGPMGIGPGGRLQYHPSYYAVETGLGYQQPYYGPPNITGLPSHPMTNTYPGEGRTGAAGNRSRYYAPAQPDPNTALIDIRVPADAKLWVEGQPTHLRGPDRGFVSPVLERGKQYGYDLKAQWTDENGKKVERTQHVRVQAGSHVVVDLRSPEL